MSNKELMSLDHAIEQVKEMQKRFCTIEAVLNAQKKVEELKAKQEKNKTIFTLRELSINTRFYRKVGDYRFSDDVYIKVYPRNFLLNSTLISDVINRGDCFIINTFNGSLLIARGSDFVEVIN